ncbi:phosphatidylinositol phosphatase PTPRQ isoform X2 [Zeugodacus cucurbitae]|uniref:phosphatidylinositol phosphatase PTPRQ isoform X2 n=1 Tax=Zeugodacus cucurbitae TaxID=28588 RepID=UPI0023D934E9|nr:phosphatidylinositol phosphatase PTPRQ isoform X2 [Zeugodacus cucurbitae]
MSWIMKKITVYSIFILLLLFGVFHCQKLDDRRIDEFVILTKTYSETITFLVNDTEKYEIVDVNCKLLGRINVDYHGKDTCYELKPCNSYVATVSIKALNVEEESIVNRTIYTSTEYSEPLLQDFFIEEYGKDQFKISWDNPKYHSCVSRYNIKWFTMDCRDDIDKDKRVKGISSIKTDSFSHKNVNIPIGYKQDPCRWSANLSDTITTYIISDLIACELYFVEIYINNATAPSIGPKSFNSHEIVPEISNISPTKINATEMGIYWNVSVKTKKCVEAYEIYVYGPLQRVEENQIIYWDKTIESNYVLKNLDACGLYKISVYAVSNNGSLGLPNEIILQTLESQPTSVQAVKIIAETQALNISWSSPQFANLCIIGYRLTGWINKNSSSQRFDKQTNGTSLYINGLYACQSYTIQIIPTTSNFDGEPVSTEVETPAKVAMASNIQALAQYPNALELSAVDSNFDNKCETIIARFLCEESKPGNATYKVARQYVEGQVKGVTFKAFLAPLSPYTSYRCGIALFNVAGWSPAEETILWTLPFNPTPPEHLTLKSSTNISLQFEWSLPMYSNGNIKLYISYFQYIGPKYFVPSKCSFVTTEAIPRETASLQQTFQNLLAYTSYSIQVAAQNEYGVGHYSRPLVVETAPWISEPLEDLNTAVFGPYPTENQYQAHVMITWTIPCTTNGEINTFQLKFFGEREGGPNHTYTRTILPVYDSNGSVTYKETNLKPDFDYIVEITVAIKNVSYSSQPTSTRFKAPSAIPEKLDDQEVQNIAVDSFASHNPTKTAVVKFPIDMLNTNLGSITYVALLVSEKGCSPAPELRFDSLNSYESWPYVMSWNDAYANNNKNCIHQYQSTEVRWNPLNGLYSNESYITYIIGSRICAESLSEMCSNFSECITEKIYCNGPLKPATEYYVVFRFFTRSGYNDVALLEFATDSVFQLTLIIICICGCLLLSLCAGISYIWISKRLFWQKDSCHVIEDSLGDIAGKTFAIYYKTLTKAEKVIREYKELAFVATDLSYSASETASNKNRYTDIFPYDKNRVLLDVDDEGSDYINASFIDGYKIKKEYIASQGPKSETTMDFWRMILQYNVRIIVMLTQFQEGTNIKCHEYFPYNSNGVSVTIRRKTCFEYYDRSEMLITHDKYGLKRKIDHFFFKKWPDHGCPKDPAHLISFIRKIKSYRVSGYSPIVIHCSAGVGRTGTFIALDIIIQRLKYEFKINIYETVKKLRFQRMKMVQTLEQYTFLYESAFELVRHKIKNKLSEENKLNFSHKTGTTTNISISE